MTFEQYQAEFSKILSAEKNTTPYDDPAFLNYTKLNAARQNRWLKTGKILPETAAVISQINNGLHWTVITEPWCGDASHTVPFLYLLSQLNDKISFDIQQRDSDSEIDKYLTNGAKAIPILIVRDAQGKDLFHWGPRPLECSQLYHTLHAANTEFEALKVALQEWYNEDKGVSAQEEITALFSSL